MHFGASMFITDYSMAPGELGQALEARGFVSKFERLLVDNNVTIVKFWLHISDEEQLRRFKDREGDPLKQWKLTPEDWRNREKRPEYEHAIEYMIATTDKTHAHWNLIGAEDKRYARVAVLETLVHRWVHDLERRGFKVPKSRGGDYLK